MEDNGASGYVKRSGILVPGGLEPKVLQTKNPIPLSFLQNLFNSIFYIRDDAPLRLIGTLGRFDSLLPRAMAADYLKRKNGQNNGQDADAVVHEIGPGNFNFARVFVDEVKPKVDSISYHGHDISDSNVAYLKDELKSYEGVIDFNKASINEFPGKVEDKSLDLILVEVLDDTLTEFFTMHEGNSFMLCVKPEMKSDLWYPSRAELGKMLLNSGDFSLLTQRMLEKSSFTSHYTARDIIDFLDTGQLEKLKDIAPSFLKGFEYYHDFIPMPVEAVYKYQWKGISDDFKEYADDVLSIFKGQLERIRNPKAYVEGDVPHTLSIPLAGIKLLWDLQYRKDVHIDFFDYGFDSVEQRIRCFSTHNGQITSPVNFELMKSAAELLGYETVLENDREFIRRNLGEDTIRLSYAKRALAKSDVHPDRVNEFMYKMFHKSVESLCPGVECNETNILSFRARRADYETFLKAGKQTGQIKDDVVVTEGSYHLSVHK